MKLIFTDLDGTLLDHDTYSFDEAKDALCLLKENNIPVIINSSKTKAEILGIRNALGIDQSPFIVENGGGIFFPGHFSFEDLKQRDGFYLWKIGKSYEKILAFFEKVKERYHMVGFHQMDVDEIAKQTNLSFKQAQQAKERNFSEPFTLGRPKLLKELTWEARAENLHVTRGGRFYHLISNRQDKGVALLKTKAIYEAMRKEKVETIALGDGENDYSMLSNCDHPVLIPTTGGEYHNTTIAGHIKAGDPGPKGWNRVVKELIYA
ncbi:MAG: HAD-IIB family hydrolase [Desulfobacteraceae bacterium]